MQAAASRDLAMLQFQHNFFDSPAPAAFTRTESSLASPGHFMKNVQAYSHTKNRKYKANEYITLIVTGPIAAGAVGHAHRARLEIVTDDEKTLTYDAVMKLAFSEDQQKKLRQEYAISEQMSVEGVPAVLGLFEPVESGPLLMLSKYCGSNLWISRRKDKFSAAVIVYPPERYVKLVTHCQLLTQRTSRAAFIKILRQIHRAGVIHNDIRAENLLIAPAGDVSIIDFDRARLLRQLDPRLRRYIRAAEIRQLISVLDGHPDEWRGASNFRLLPSTTGPPQSLGSDESV